MCIPGWRGCIIKYLVKLKKKNIKLGLKKNMGYSKQKKKRVGWVQKNFFFQAW